MRFLLFPLLVVAACASSGIEKEQQPSHAAAIGDLSLSELSLQATRALASHRYRQAVELYIALSEREPFDPAHRQALGYALVRLERWDQALEEFEEAYRLDPTSRETMLGLGVARFRVGDLLGAQSILQEGLDTFEPGSDRRSWKLVVERQLPGIEIE